MQQPNDRSFRFEISCDDLVHIASAVNNAQRMARGSNLKIVAAPVRVSETASELTWAFLNFVGQRDSAQRDELPAKTAKWAATLAKAASEVLEMLDADSRGPDGDQTPYVPPPNRLIDYPVRTPPAGYMSAIEMGDAARDAMLSEMQATLANPSAFGAHDVARVTVAALRQLRKLAEATQEGPVVSARVRLRRTNMADLALFRSLAKAFQELHGAPYSVTNTATAPDGSNRESTPTGKAMAWTLKLLRLAADRAKNTPLREVLEARASDAKKHPDGLARRMKQSTKRPRDSKGKKTEG
jgi:hypothetical protein